MRQKGLRMNGGGKEEEEENRKRKKRASEEKSDAIYLEDFSYSFFLLA